MFFPLFFSVLNILCCNEILKMMHWVVKLAQVLLIEWLTSSIKSIWGILANLILQEWIIHFVSLWELKLKSFIQHAKSDISVKSQVMLMQTKQQGITPPPLSKRLAKERTKLLLECCQCGLIWEKNNHMQRYFVLPCQDDHTLCPLCFLLLMAKKGVMHNFNCLCCNKKEEKHAHLYVYSPKKTLVVEE